MEMGSSSFSSNMEGIQSICLEDDKDNISPRKKDKALEKKSSSSTKNQNRKIPRGLWLKPLGQGDEEYNEEGEDMNTNDENKEEEDTMKEEPVDKK